VLGAVATASAQTSATRDVSKDTVVIAGEIYKAGSLHRALLGKNYRQEWTTPIAVPVLDLKTAHGGLTPKKEGGGKQAPSLRFVAPDSSEWVFRLVRKIHLVLGDEFRHTVIWYIVRDEGSASHPTGAIAAAPLYAIPALLHATPKLYYMPDDPALGEFRKTFGGVLGMLEEYPEVPKSGKAFAGAERIIDSDTLLARLNTDPQTRIDTRALLTARLMDMLLGDNDRHPDQWKWARFSKGDDAVWEPIGRDRDKKALRAVGGLEAQSAKTRIHVLERFLGGKWSLIQARPLTGRTHQIRVHLKSIGCPLAIDELYGDPKAIAPPVIERLSLHAHKLTWPSPRDGKTHTAEASLPDDYRLALDALRGKG